MRLLPLALQLRPRLGGVGAQRAAAAVAPREEVLECPAPARGLLQSKLLLLPKLKVLDRGDAAGLRGGFHVSRDGIEPIAAKAEGDRFYVNAEYDYPFSAGLCSVFLVQKSLQANAYAAEPALRSIWHRRKSGVSACQVPFISAPPLPVLAFLNNVTHLHSRATVRSPSNRPSLSSILTAAGRTVDRPRLVGIVLLKWRNGSRDRRSQAGISLCSRRARHRRWHKVKRADFLVSILTAAALLRRGTFVAIYVGPRGRSELKAMLRAAIFLSCCR